MSHNFNKNISICDDSIWKIYRIFLRFFFGIFIFIHFWKNTSFFQGQNSMKSFSFPALRRHGCGFAAPISYDMIWYHMISYHMISYPMISYHMISYDIISYHIISNHMISYDMISLFITFSYIFYKLFHDFSMTFPWLFHNFLTNFGGSKKCQKILFSRIIRGPLGSI